LANATFAYQSGPGLSGNRAWFLLFPQC